MPPIDSVCIEAPPANLVELLQRQAALKPDACAFSFLWEDEGETALSYAELDAQAKKIAGALQQVAVAGERALLVFPPGLDFIPAFFGCLYAGILAVPATYPKPRRPSPRLSAIAEDCKATVALTTSQTLATLDLARLAPELLSLEWIATDELPDETADHWDCASRGSRDLAFLQYTSGSTSEPKGVMVSHGNLLQNLEMIRQGFDIARICAGAASDTGVCWLPAYHDMGLIGGILESIYVGGRSILMSPAAFLQRPLRWLKAISDYRAVISGAPNFAFELCVHKIAPQCREQLDLSSWQIAFCGAEPIRSETLAGFARFFAPCGFRADAFYPCYGLAEATLLAAGGRGPARPKIARVQRCGLANHRVLRATRSDNGQAQKLVACGRPLLDQQIVIVDPQTGRRCDRREVGEVWIKGPNVAQGYWNRSRENEETFNAHRADTGEGGYLRTGDLGFLLGGNLYVTGRVKDVIIIRGRNHYPQDIERTMTATHPALPSGAGAAFSIEVHGRERLVVVHEVDRQHRNVDFHELIRSMRRSIAVEHELDVHAVVLIRPANLPRTTSGKVQRNLCRERYLAGELKALAQWTHGEDSSLNGRRAPHPPSSGHGGGTGNGNGNGKGHVAGNGSARHDGNGSHPANANGSSSRAAPAPVKSILPEIKLPDRRLRPEELDRLSEQIQTWIADWLVERAGVRTADIEPDRPFAEFGLDSLTAVELSRELEDWLKIELTPVLAWNYPTLATLSRYLAGHLAGMPEGSEEAEAKDPSRPAADDEPSDAELERLLAEIETLSEDEANTALNRGTGD